MPLAAGTRLDGYEILALQGAGGMGKLYRARDPASLLTDYLVPGGGLEPPQPLRVYGF